MLDPETGEVTEAFVFDEVEAVAPYREAIAQIEAGSFEPKPVSRACPTCPFLFCCGV